MMKTCLTSQNLATLEDYSTTTCDDLTSHSSLFLVLNLHCREIPNVNLSLVDIQAFKVAKPGCPLRFYVLSGQAYTPD